MKYNEMTQAQKDLRQKLWEEVLETFCHADEEGCRPCDRGCPCDNCQYDHNLNQKYHRLMKSKGLPLTDDEVIEPCTCPHCEKDVDPEDLRWVSDRYGNPFQKVCSECYDEVEEEIYGWELDESYAGERLEEDY